MFGILSVVWVIVGIALWVSYKLKHAPDTHDVVCGPPQCTLLGSLVWPFYLVGFFTDTLSTIFLRK